MIPIAKPLLGPEEANSVLKVLESGMLAQGAKVAEFEQMFAQFIGVRHAIATSNGTTALHAALLAHGIGPGDEVITTPFTFIATANAIKMAGATPVFVDIEEQTFNINPYLIEAAITSKTKALLPVHLFGHPANMEQIQQIAQTHNLVVIEDACQAHGARFQGKKVGSFGTGCFSFYPTKNMTAGEGGMITTNNDQLAEKLRKIINHGSTQKYVHDSVGYNYRMTDIAAAIGVEQLKKLEVFNQKRLANARYLHQKISSIPGIITPLFPEGHALHQYTLRITPQFKVSRDTFIKLSWEKGIGAAIFYPVPIHQQKAYFSYNHLIFPIAEKVAQEVVSLPVHPAVTKTDLDHIAAVIREVS